MGEYIQITARDIQAMKVQLEMNFLKRQAKEIQIFKSNNPEVDVIDYIQNNSAEYRKRYFA